MREIWTARHDEDPDRVAAILSKAEFDDMRLRAQRQWALLTLHSIADACTQILPHVRTACSPTFMFKVPRSTHFTVVVATFPVVTVDKPVTCLFSLADEFRQSAHSCSPVFAVNFHTELASTKDVVLVRGTILPGVHLERYVANQRN